jgi:TonB family protein
MLDSTARAERIDSTTSEAVCYTWEGPQKALAVRLPLPLIDRLESEAVETFRSLTSRGSEIGGLLLGYSAPGAQTVLTVSDFELISCDYTRGPLYRLSDGDVTRFEQAIQKHSGNTSTRVIGYFRSHTRKGLLLDAEDLAFLEPRFPDPLHVVLLIRPFAAKVSSAGIFIRQNGKFNGENSHREFPFRSPELALLRSNDKPETSVSSASPAAPTAAQPALPPKPQSRAQIVPIASRREIAPEPVVAPPTLPPLVVERVEAPAPPAPPAAKTQPPDRIEARVEAPAPAAPKPQPAAPAAEKDDKGKAAAQPAKAVEAPAATAAVEAPDAEIDLPVAAKKNKKLRLLVAAAIGMLVLGGGGLIVYPTLVHRVNRPARTAQQDSSPLALRAERTAGGMLLTWNRDLPVIQSASKVVLSISDGDRHENIQLDPNQVRTGSILYQPNTGDVSFQMEVTDPRQSKTTSESLRVLDPRPSPLDQPSGAASKDNPAVKPAATPDATPTSTSAEDTKAPDDTPAVKPAANLKPFNTASLAQRLRPVTQADLPDDAPAIGRAAAPSGSGSLPGMEASQVVPPPPPKPAVPVPTPPSAVKVGGQLVSARVLSKVDPEYPKLARQAGAGGVVELEATITADGRVKNPHVIRGNTMLQKSAIDAVLQWRYQPAMLNGKPVESPVEIKLNFVTQGR